MATFLAGKSQQTIPARGRGQKRDATEDQGRMFSQMLEEESSKGKKEKSKDNTEKSLIEGQKEKTETQDKKEFVRDKGKTDNKSEELQKKLQEQVQKKMTQMNPTLNYLYNLMYKNPDALSMTEKQMFQLEQHSEYGVGMKEFNSLLKQKGLKLSMLSFNQIAKLARCKTRSQVTAFLDQMVDAKRKGELKERTEKTLVDIGKEKIAERQAVERGEAPKGRMENAAETARTQKEQQAQNAEKTQRQVKREEVIDQVIKQLEINNVGRMTELQLKLNPEYLGELKMKLTFEDGHMTAHFETTSQEVREMLKESVDDLTSQFGKKGLKVDKTDVKLVDTIE